MVKDGAIFVKGRIRGEVNFPPFERLDEETKREVEHFQVHPLGKIQEYSRHIPYNSEKKSFLEKTGRESFEGKKSDSSCSMASADPSCSISVHFQSSWRREGLHSAVGLQYRPRSHHPILQMLQVLQGPWFLLSFFLELQLTLADNSSKNAQPKSWP
jgi:hypothetical protein